jgi:hypothetical protein
MNEERDPRRAFERYESFRVTQHELERIGYYFHPIEREHTEGLIVDPLLARVNRQIKRRGFAKVATKMIFTFSGYVEDPREIEQIPEVRAWWRRFDSQLPELPALLGFLPAMEFNGPGQHLLLLGEIAETIHRPEIGGYDSRVTNAQQLIDDAARRIRQAATKYHLPSNAANLLIEHFIRSATYRRPET